MWTVTFICFRNWKSVRFDLNFNYLNFGSLGTVIEMAADAVFMTSRPFRISGFLFTANQNCLGLFSKPIKADTKKTGDSVAMWAKYSLLRE